MKLFKKPIIMLFATLIFLCNQLSAQTLLSLTNYRIPVNKKGAVIGKFNVDNVKEIKIIKDASNLFVIDTHGNLALKPNKSIKANQTFIYEVVVQYGDTQKAFDLVTDNFSKNRIVAHRGAWKHHDVNQNSMGSLKKAVDLAVCASEFDVWLSKDGVAILNHDRDINGLMVEETDAVELRKITLKGGETLPTLEEYIKFIKTQNVTRLVLELKSDKNNRRALALADSVVNIVHTMKAQAWVDYISFDYDALLRVRALDPTAHTAYLADDKTLEQLKADGISGIDYHYSLFEKDSDLCQKARTLGLTINTWTVNDEKLLSKFIKMDVDFITTDEPELMRTLMLQERKEPGK